jgi:hypothetical protein
VGASPAFQLGSFVLAQLDRLDSEHGASRPRLTTANHTRVSRAALIYLHAASDGHRRIAEGIDRHLSGGDGADEG